MTREQIQDFLAMIQATYPNFNPPSKTAAVNAWTLALEDYEEQAVHMAFKLYMQTNTSGFAPVPGQIIDKIHTMTAPQELNEMEAWSLVSKAIRNSGYNSVEEFAKLPPTVRKAVGLPSQLRTWALDENYNEIVVSSNFIKTYRNVVKQNREMWALPNEIREKIESNGESSKYITVKDPENKVQLIEKIVGVPMPDSIKEKYKEMLKE